MNAIKIPIKTITEEALALSCEWQAIPKIEVLIKTNGSPSITTAIKGNRVTTVIIFKIEKISKNTPPKKMITNPIITEVSEFIFLAIRLEIAVPSI